MGRFEILLEDISRGKREPYFPWGLVPDENGLVALGGQLTVDVVLEAYTKSYFPWTGEHPIPWYSPDPRLILPPDAFHASRSLRKLVRQGRYRVEFDRRFRNVMEKCASIPREGQDGTWITPNMIEVYTQLHTIHIAHSVEVIEVATDELCGGLYGITLGRAFFGESMFSERPNTSKLALYMLCQELGSRDFDFIDCQQETEHLESLGAFAIDRLDYLERLSLSVQAPSHHYSWKTWALNPPIFEDNN